MWLLVEPFRLPSAHRATATLQASPKQVLTDELIHQEEWFPISLAPDRSYEVSHIDSPILGPGPSIALMLSLVPSAEPMSGAAVTRLGTQLAAATRRLSEALTESG